MKKTYNNVTVIIENDNAESDTTKLARILLTSSEFEIRDALKIVAKGSPKTIVRIAQSCHGRMYDMIGLGR